RADVALNNPERVFPQIMAEAFLARPSRAGRRGYQAERGGVGDTAAQRDLAKPLFFLGKIGKREGLGFTRPWGSGASWCAALDPRGAAWGEDAGAGNGTFLQVSRRATDVGPTTGLSA